MASIDKQMQLLGSQARAAAETLAFSTFEQRSLAVSEGAKSISNQIDLIYQQMKLTCRMRAAKDWTMQC